MAGRPAHHCWTGSAGKGWARSLSRSLLGPSLRTSSGFGIRVARKFGGQIWLMPTMKPNHRS
eukprot:12357386-Alexandrium_andersonii.AAC.1